MWQLWNCRLAVIVSWHGNVAHHCRVPVWVWPPRWRWPDWVVCSILVNVIFQEDLEGSLQIWHQRSMSLWPHVLWAFIFVKLSSSRERQCENLWHHHSVNSMGWVGTRRLDQREKHNCAFSMSYRARGHFVGACARWVILIGFNRRHLHPVSKMPHWQQVPVRPSWHLIWCWCCRRHKRHLTSISSTSSLSPGQENTEDTSF